MKRIALMLMLALLVSCGESNGKLPDSKIWPDNDMGRYHDVELKVTCWVYASNRQNGAMTCIPDWQLVAPK